MKYLYRAKFEHGTTFCQPADDESRLWPGVKSSMYDFRALAETRTLDRLELVEAATGSYVCGLDCATGSFDIDGHEVTREGSLPDNFAWVSGDPDQGVYFRRITKTFSGTTELDTQTQFCFGVKAEPGVRNFLGVT